MNKGLGDQIFGIVLCVVAAVIFTASFQIKTMLPMNPGPEFMPRVASILLLVLGIAIYIEGLGVSKNTKTQPASAGEQPAKLGARDNGGLLNVLKSAVLLGAYVATLESVGFLITTALYIFLQGLIMMEGRATKKVWMLAAAAVIVPILTYFTFTRGLYLMLPPGILDI